MSIISIEDILKSAIGSIFGAFITTIFGYLFTSKLFFRSQHKSEQTSKAYQKSTLKEIAFLVFLFTLMFALKIVILKDYENNGGFLAISISIILSSSINYDLIFAPDFFPKFHKGLLLLLISFPLFSYGKALDDANSIFENTKFKYALIKNTEATENSDTIKFLGLKDEFLIFTNKNNLKTYFIKSDTIILMAN